jgi:hypothetical protein
MTQPKLTLEERLVKYTISRQRYKNETVRLLAAGFTLQQADKIILRHSSKNTVEGVLQLYATLSSEPYQFTLEQIVAMASNAGGAQALKTVITFNTSFQNLGFSQEQIVAMASKHGGAQALKTVITFYTSLQNLGFSQEQIAAMASKHGGAQALKTVILSHISLGNLGFSQEQIAAMASNGGGAQALKTVISSHTSLGNLGFSNKQIAAIASNGGGAQAIKAVIKHYPELSSHGYSLKSITALAARIGGATTIKKTNEREFINFINEHLIYESTAEIPQNPVHTTYENNAHEPTYYSQSIEKSSDSAEDFLFFEDDSETSKALSSNSQALKQQGLFAIPGQRKRSLVNAEENTSGNTVSKRTKTYSNKM